MGENVRLLWKPEGIAVSGVTLRRKDAKGWTYKPVHNPVCRMKKFTSIRFDHGTQNKNTGNELRRVKGNINWREEGVGFARMEKRENGFTNHRACRMLEIRSIGALLNRTGRFLERGL